MKLSIESMNKDFGNNIDVVLNYDKQSKVNKPLTLGDYVKQQKLREACKINFLGWN